MNGAMDDMIAWYPIWRWEQNEIWQRRLVRFIVDLVEENPAYAWIALGVGIAVAVGVMVRKYQQYLANLTVDPLALAMG